VRPAELDLVVAALAPHVELVAAVDLLGLGLFVDVPVGLVRVGAAAFAACLLLDALILGVDDFAVLHGESMVLSSGPHSLMVFVHTSTARAAYSCSPSHEHGSTVSYVSCTSYWRST
jgi:hypothetical protein